MRTVPHIEIRSLPAPQESQVQIQTANRDNSPIFAQTLKRKSASDEQADRANKDSKLVAKPDEALDGATTTDDLPVVNAMTVDSTNVPVNPLTLGDFGIGLPTNAVESADVALTSGTDVSQEHLAAAATTTDTAATALALHTQTTAKPATDQTDQSDQLPAAAVASFAPIHSATPATQATGMNAIAAAIGEKKQDEASDKSHSLETKSLNESSLIPLQPGPTAQVTATRPMSDTVLTQNTQAANGNAMEKALSHQVSKAIIQNMPNGDRVLVMRLTPPELGTVKIEIIERMGVLTAKLHAEDDGVRLALERFLPSMRQDLRASDAPIRELSLSDQTQFQHSFDDGQNQQQQQQDGDTNNNRRSRIDEPRFSIDGNRNETTTAPRSSAPLGGRVSLFEVNVLA